MGKLFNFLWVVFILCFVQCRKPDAKEEFITGRVDITNYTKFYVDSKNGDNYKNTGMSPDSPFKNIWRVDEKLKDDGKTLGERMAILLKRGSEFKESIELIGVNGSASAPIVISDFGDEDASKPLLKGNKLATIKIENASYVDISNVDISNLKITNSTTELKAKDAHNHEAIFGINAVVTKGNTSRNIHIRDNEFLDIVNGYSISFFNADDGASRYDNILIEDNKINNKGAIQKWEERKQKQQNILNTGIIFFTGNNENATTKPKVNTNVIIKNNTLEYVGGSVIFIQGCDGAIIEGNYVKNSYPVIYGYAGGTKKPNATVAIWPMHCKNTTIRGNVVQDYNAMADGQAFDIDADNENILVEYNLSYNNAGGFILLCPFSDKVAPHRNSVIRYNVSIDDGVREFKLSDSERHLEYEGSSAFFITGKVESAYIYNNTIIKTKETKVNSAFYFSKGYQNSNSKKSIVVANNIFYTTASKNNKFIHLEKEVNLDKENMIVHNNYIQGYSGGAIGTENSDYNRDNIYNSLTDPSPFKGAVGNFGQYIDRSKVTANLVPKENAPLISKALAIWELENKYPALKLNLFNLKADFWGQYIGQSKTIGAYNH